MKNIAKRIEVWLNQQKKKMVFIALVGGTAGIAMAYSVAIAPIQLEVWGFTQARAETLVSPISSPTGGSDIDIIWAVAEKRGFKKEDTYKLLKIADCESNLNQWAINKNRDGSLDLGLYQINEKYHPEYGRECLFNIACATNAAIDIANAWGGFEAWTCARLIN